MYFACEMNDSHMKINFTYEIFISLVELKHFYIRNAIFMREMTREIFVKDVVSAIRQ